MSTMRRSFWGAPASAPCGSPQARPTPWPVPRPVLVHQLHDTSAALRLPRVQLLQGLLPLGDGITDLEEAKQGSQKSAF